MKNLMFSFVYVCIFISTPSRGVIHSLVSTTSGTKHTYVCESELHTFRCTITGTELVWSINTSTPIRIVFVNGDGIGHSVPRSQAIGVLLRNDRSINQLQSALFVNYSREFFDQTTTYRINCSSDNESDSLHTSFSSPPQKPEFTQVLPLDFNQTLAHYHLRWNAPANIVSTSIDHYILSIGSRNMSVHNTQTDAVVAINRGEERELKVYGVDRCNQTGSYDYIEIIQPGSLRVSDCPLSTRTSTESPAIVIYIILVIVSVIVLLSSLTFITVIVGFKVARKQGLIKPLKGDHSGSLEYQRKPGNRRKPSDPPTHHEETTGANLSNTATEETKPMRHNSNASTKELLQRT